MRIRMTLMMILAAFAFFAQRAAATTIADILANPAAYDGNSVTLTGTVDAVLPVGTESGYNLRAGSAVMTVISRAAAPAVGAHLNVTGTIRVFKEGNDSEDNTFPPALIESARSPAP